MTSMSATEVSPELILNEGEIEISNMEIREGPNARIFSGVVRSTEVVIKQLRTRFTAEQLARLPEELKDLAKVNRHPHLVPHMGICLSTFPMFVMEPFNRDLEALLITNPRPEPTTRLQKLCMARDAALGMAWLHSRGVVHKNLKLRNLLVDSSLKVLVSDYWFNSLQCNQYTPPEYGASGPVTPKYDVYAFGICLWEIFNQKRWYLDGFSETVFLDLICNGLRPPVSTDKEEDQLLARCWRASPEDRPEFLEIARELDRMIVADSIPGDNDGRLFWLNHFPNKSKASWDTFKTLCNNHINPRQALDRLQVDANTLWACLKALFIPEAGNVLADEVSLERFGKVLAWFGPFSRDGSFVERVITTVRFPWFHGDVSTEDSVHLLNAAPTRTYLVRFSNRERGAFTISRLKRRGCVIHYRVEYLGPGNFHLDDSHTKGNSARSSSYPSLNDLILTHKKTLKLETPCPNSKYSLLFPTRRPAPQQEPKSNSDAARLGTYSG